jgi:hypothetical protein
LEGLPVVTRMSGREQSLCVNPVITPAMQLVNQEQLENWIQSVFDDSGGHHAFSIEPWFFEAVNLECWWAILFDSNLTQKFFLNLRAALLDEYNVGNLREYYSDRTGFAKKVQLIEIFFRESESGKLEKAFKLIRRITQDFPNCGTYFQREGAEYFRLIKDIRQKRKGLNN